MPQSISHTRSKYISSKYCALRELLLYHQELFQAPACNVPSYSLSSHRVEMASFAGGLWRARAEMVKLTRLYDSSKVSAPLFGVLLAAGCADIALALARRQQLNPQQEAAMKAAAGQWQPAVAAALKAHQQLLSYPRCASFLQDFLDTHAEVNQSGVLIAQQTDMCWKLTPIK